MREKNPIDDRFKEALYHAEVEPPAALRNAVMARLDASAGPRPIGGIWPTALLLVGLVGAGTAISSWNGFGDPVAEQPTDLGSEFPAPLPVRSVKARDPGNIMDSRLGTDKNSAQPSTSQGPGDAGTGGERVADHRTNTLTMNDMGSAPGLRSNDTSPGSHPTTRSIHSDSGAFSGSRPLSSSAISVGPPIGTRVNTITMDAPLAALLNSEQVQGTSMAHPGDRDPDRTTPRGSGLGLKGASADHMDPLPITFNDPGLGSPGSASNDPAYVLPSGVWWLGAYVGSGTVQGEWKGSDLETLDQAEDWLSTGQAGLQFGRAWRSGWSVSAGLGLSMVRSRFDYKTTGPSSSFLEVDTTWSEYAHTTTGVPLYTWVIDSMIVDRPGSLSRVDSRNRYAAVQVPLTVHWYGDLRRFRLGAFGGVMAWIPTQRQGLTLAGPIQDGSPTTLPLQDARVSDRFAAQLHGQAGMSVGYFVTEHFSAYVEPLISTPILSFSGGETPWLTRPTLQIRIQHEIRYRPH